MFIRKNFVSLVVYLFLFCLFFTDVDSSSIKSRIPAKKPDNIKLSSDFPLSHVTVKFVEDVPVRLRGGNLFLRVKRCLTISITY